MLSLPKKVYPRKLGSRAGPGKVYQGIWGKMFDEEKFPITLPLSTVQFLLKIATWIPGFVNQRAQMAGVIAKQFSRTLLILPRGVTTPIQNGKFR